MKLADYKTCFDHKFLKDTSPFCGAIDTPALDFWWRVPWVSKPGWIPTCVLPHMGVIGFLRFTSGATPADLLVAGIAFNGWWWTFKNNRLFNGMIELHLTNHLEWTANFEANGKDQYIESVEMS